MKKLTKDRFVILEACMYYTCYNTLIKHEYASVFQYKYVSLYYIKVIRIKIHVTGTPNLTNF